MAGGRLILQVVRWPLSFYLIWYVSNLVIEGHLTVGDYGALYGMYMGSQWMFHEFGRMWLNLQDQAAAARRVFFFMDLVADE